MVLGSLGLSSPWMRALFPAGWGEGLLLPFASSYFGKMAADTGRSGAWRGASAGIVLQQETWALVSPGSLASSGLGKSSLLATGLDNL